MLELLNQSPLVRTGRVLEIGTGCAYQATVLARIAKEVYTIERIAALHILARKNISPLRLKNVHLIMADGLLGYPKGAPYAGIISAAGGEDIPQAWLDQLEVGGRLVAPAHINQHEQAILVVDRSMNGFTKRWFEGVHFVPLMTGLLR
jgi:protein-L-isoaspartate(D-aspartate) O-methyltransferase